MGNPQLEVGIQPHLPKRWYGQNRRLEWLEHEPCHYPIDHQPKLYTLSIAKVQLIGLRDKIQEDPIFHWKTYGFL